MRSLVVKLSVIAVIPLVAIGYTNCSKVGFQNYELSSEAQEALSTGGVLINDGAEYTNSNDVMLRLIHNSADEMYITDSLECADGGTWEDYSPTKIWNLQANNSQGKVYAKFRTREQPSFESPCFADDIVHDDIAPEIAFKRAPGGIFNSANFAFEIVMTDNLSGIGIVNCHSNADWSSACSPGTKVHAMKEGVQLITASATDKAGNKSAPASDSFLIDLTPPVLSWLQTPQAVTSDPAAQFAFLGTDALSGLDKYECKADAGAWAACSSPVAQTFAEGNRAFAVRAYDVAGNVSFPLSFSWVIDATAPSVTITLGPQGVVNQTTATFGFMGLDNGVAISKFECRMDNSAYASCASGISYPGLSEGSHKFEVRGYDSANNPSAPANRSFVIDITLPVVTLVSTPEARSPEKSGSFVFTATDANGIKEIQCKMDGDAFAKCTSPLSFTNLVDGSHSFQIYAVDNAGNSGAIKSYTWVIDTTKPVVTIVSGPNRESRSTAATFAFTAMDPNGGSIARIDCQLDGGGFSACTSAKDYVDLMQGIHFFQVRAVDDVGNMSDVQSYEWKIDSLGPAINFGQVPAAQIYFSKDANIQFTVTDDGSGLQSILCGFVGTSLQTCSASFQYAYRNLPIGSYTFRVEAKDNWGNASAKEINFAVETNIIDKSQSVLVGSNNKADVLVVIDNSGSMKTEQANMASRFSTFLDKLSGLDWQVGIVTTDVSANARLKDGRLVVFTDMPGTYVLNSGMDSAAAKSSFGKTIQRSPSEGSSNEQGIAATYRAVERAFADQSVVENARNRTLFRDDAVLSVIVVTDADETNPNGTQTYNKPDELRKLVRSKWPNKSFVFHSIIVPINDKVCVAQDGNEQYGYTYDSLSQLTGGIRGTVCSTDYGSQLAAIGQATMDQIRSVSLDCAPLDMNGDSVPDISVVTANGTATPSYSVSGLTVTFSVALPAGTNQLNYSCLIP